MEHRVIVLEFNELCPDLIERFIRQGALPNFARVRSESSVYTTDAEEKFPNLEPWIQWVTVHTGLTFKEHGIFNLGDGPALNVKCLWDLLSDKGYRVGVCGSMNLCYQLPIDGYVLPDPWTAGAKPYPDELMDYYAFVRQHVQEYTNEHARLSLKDNLRFLKFMFTHGLSLNTIGTIVRQLASERTGGARWKRAAILDKLQFDVFQSEYRRLSPHFSTFFLNSTAHMQHTYWRNMEPELFTVKPTGAEQAEYAEAILFGYQQMDDLIGRFIQLAGSDATLVFTTALSQQPCLIYEDIGGKLLYRPKNIERLIDFADVHRPHKIAPVMAEQFYIHFENETDAREAEAKMGCLQVNGETTMWLQRQGASLFAGCTIHTALPQAAVLTLSGTQKPEQGRLSPPNDQEPTSTPPSQAPLFGRDSRKSTPFFDLFYLMEGMKSGMHHPDGMLWIRTPQRDHTVHEGKVPLTSVAPTILSLFDVAQPAYMKGEALDEFRKVRT